MIVSNCPRCTEPFRIPEWGLPNSGPSGSGLPADTCARCPWCQESFPVSEILQRLPPVLHLMNADGEALECSPPQSAAAFGEASSGLQPSTQLWQGSADPASGGGLEVVDSGFDSGFDATTIDEPPVDPGMHQAGIHRAGIDDVTDDTWRAGAATQDDADATSNPEPESDGFRAGSWDDAQPQDGGADVIAPMRVSPAPASRRSKGSPIRTVLSVVLGGLAAGPIAVGILWVMTLFGVDVDLGFYPLDGNQSSGSPSVVAADPPVITKRLPRHPPSQNNQRSLLDDPPADDPADDTDRSGDLPRSQDDASIGSDSADDALAEILRDRESPDQNSGNGNHHQTTQQGAPETSNNPPISPVASAASGEVAEAAGPAAIAIDLHGSTAGSELMLLDNAEVESGESEAPTTFDPSIQGDDLEMRLATTDDRTASQETQLYINPTLGINSTLEVIEPAGDRPPRLSVDPPVRSSDDSPTLSAPVASSTTSASPTDAPPEGESAEHPAEPAEQLPAEIVELKSELKKLGDLSSLGPGDKKRQRQLAVTYVKIAAIGVSAQHDPKTAGLLLETIKSTATFDDLGDAASQWLDHPRRPSEGVLLVGEAGTGSKGNTITINDRDDRRDIVVSDAFGSLPSTGRVISIGLIINSPTGPTVELLAVEPLP